MSMKEISELLKDLIESQKQLTLRLKMVEIELTYIKENLPERITNIIEKTEKFDKKVSQKYIKELLSKKLASGNTYQKGSILQAYYPTLNYISVEKIKEFNVKATGVDKKLPHLNKKWIQTRRALGIKRNNFQSIGFHRNNIL